MNFKEEYTEEYITANADSLDWYVATIKMTLSDKSFDFFERFKDFIVWYDLFLKIESTLIVYNLNLIELLQDLSGFKVSYNESGNFHSYNDIPSFVAPDGFKSWHKDGKLHRYCGPAVINKEGLEFHFIDGVQY